MDWRVNTLNFLGPRHTERHLRLTEAAINVFAESGLAETSISDISARAEVARTQFYFAWEDRADCFTFCHHICLAEVEQAIERSVADVDAWQDRLLAGCEAVAEIVTEKSEIARVLLLDGPSSRREVDIERRRQAEDRLADALLHLYLEASGDTVEAEPRAARMAIGAAKAVLVSYLEAPDEHDGNLVNDLIVALLSFNFGPAEARTVAVALT